MQTVHILEANETQRNALPLRYNILGKVDDLCGLAVDVVDINPAMLAEGRRRVARTMYHNSKIKLYSEWCVEADA